MVSYQGNGNFPTWIMWHEEPTLRKLLAAYQCIDMHQYYCLEAMQS